MITNNFLPLTPKQSIIPQSTLHTEHCSNQINNFATMFRKIFRTVFFAFSLLCMNQLHLLSLMAKNNYSEPAIAENTNQTLNVVHQVDAVAPFTPDEYEKVLSETLKVLPDANSGYCDKTFYAGLNNQLIRFIGMNFIANEDGVRQILKEGVNWMDNFGTGKQVVHHKLWDVVHWNTFYPTLPRFVSYDKDVHTDIEVVRENHEMIAGKKHLAVVRPQMKYKVEVSWENRTQLKPQPYQSGRHQAWFRFQKLGKAVNNNNVGDKGPRKVEHVIQETILKGALRPHPFLQNVIENELLHLRAGGKFMTLHARVEPDMAKQDFICQTKKVYNVTEIIDVIHAKFPEPPVTTVLIQFSRAVMEKLRPNDKLYALNDHNLKEINRIAKEGMWGGKVKVVEAGSRLVEQAGDPFYAHYSSIAGGIVNLFLAIQSDYFVGTEVSTYSTIAVNARFYREEKESYFYRPDALHLATPLNKPHRFVC